MSAFSFWKRSLVPPKKAAPIRPHQPSNSRKAGAAGGRTPAGATPQLASNGSKPAGATVDVVKEAPEHGKFPNLPASLSDHVLYQDGLRPQKFGALAVAMGFLSHDRLDELLRLQQNSGGRIGEVALKHELLTSEQISQILAQQRPTVFVDARHAATAAFLTWLSDVKRAGFHVQVKAVSVQELAELRESGFGKRAGADDNDGLKNRDAAIQLIADCAAIGGSDIHILVRERYAEIQLRVKGELKVIHGITKDEGESLIRAMYVGLTSVKDALFNPYEFQDAQISGDALPETGLSSVRIIRGPAYPVESGGGFLVARLQYRRSGATPAKLDRARPLSTRTPSRPGGELRLPTMGYTPLQVALLERMTRMPSGVILITGPTGSGKTTTLFELMQHQARMFPGARQITVENPVEYPMPWAVQLPVTASNGASFLDMVRMTLRMDPDIVLIGELRSADEAVAALQEAMTGHLVWTTLHVTDPYMAIDRLEAMDRSRLSRAIICDHKLVRGLISQRLVSRLCPHCKKPLRGSEGDLPPGMLDALKTWGEIDAVHLRGDGCERCHGEAITGASAVAEVVAADESLMRDFIEHGTSVARRNHRLKEGVDQSMLANAITLVLQGLVDPRDVERSVDVICAKGDDL